MERINKIISSILLLAFLNCTISTVYSLPSQQKKPTIAVLNFQSNTGDDSIDVMLSTGTSETIITDLSNIEEIDVVERTRIVEAMKEIAFGMTGFIDEKTAQQAGKIVGAQYILMGNWQRFSGQFRVNARLVEVETGKIIVSIKETGNEYSLFDIQDNISEHILSNLKISLSEEEKMRIRKRETVSIDAYKEFSKGLKEYDRGNSTAMKYHMEKALEYDPNYEKPKEYIYVIGGDDTAPFHEIKASSASEAKMKHLVYSTLSLAALFGAVSLATEEDDTGPAIIVGGVLGVVLGLAGIIGGTEKKSEKRK